MTKLPSVVITVERGRYKEGNEKAKFKNYLKKSLEIRLTPN